MCSVCMSTTGVKACTLAPLHCLVHLVFPRHDVLPGSTYQSDLMAPSRAVGPPQELAT